MDEHYTARVSRFDVERFGSHIELRVIELVAQQLAAQYLSAHGTEVLARLNPEAIATMSIAEAGAAVNETLQEVVHTCLQLHGGTGYMIGTPIERMARDARILTIGGGATEVMLEEVAKRM